MARGTLITIEGIDGAGKSTLARALVDALGQRGLPVELLREPGGVELSERIRALVKDPALTVGARAEALLYAAARAQLVEERVEPLLAAGRTVLLDRFVDSSLAYQGAARGLGVQAVREINELATAGLAPARTLLLRIEPAAGRARQHGRLEAAVTPGPGESEPDRLELEDDGFFAAIAEAYEALARAEPERFRAIDAEQAPAAVLEDALAALADLAVLAGAPL